MVPAQLSLRLSDREHQLFRRPRTCPNCGSSIMQRWGKVNKPGWNPAKDTMLGCRYKCMECDKTFRMYPDSGSSQYANRDVRRLAVMAWMIGLSLSTVVDLFGEFGVTMSRSTVWRATRDLLGEAAFPGIPVTATVDDREDKTTTRFASPVDLAVLIEVGMEQTVKLNLASEESSYELQRWLKFLANELELELVTQEKGYGRDE